jgi:3-oxoacyl-[acyl-carrier-protein] synthase III
VAGNAVQQYRNTAILSVIGVDAPEVVTSADFDERLATTYERLKLRPGMLQQLAGIHERRWWPTDVRFVDAAAMAGAKALAEAGVDPGRVGLLIDSSVCRLNLEPSAALTVHHELGLPSSCLNFDLANACLGFVNGMQLAATMIDAGQIDYALVVDGEGSRQTQEATLDRLAREDATAADLAAQFATLTLGSGGAAAVLGRADEHPEGHRFVRSVARAATQHHDLCVGDLTQMRTDSRGLLTGGMECATDLWRDNDTDWQQMDMYVAHQVSIVHTNLMCEQLGIDAERLPLTFPTRGNMGPASVPFTLAVNQHTLGAGDQVLLMGIGSGINAMATEIIW